MKSFKPITFRSRRRVHEAPNQAGTGQAEALAEGRRILTICNACRYCEGYCAVFPAMERVRLINADCQDFGTGDLHYLANLCHNCAECYYACQYAPPHQFAVNVPQVLAEIRLDSYRRYAWPQFLAGLFERSGQLALTTLAITIVIGFVVGQAASAANPASFYTVIPHGVMVVVFGAASGLAAAALGIGVARQFAGVIRNAGRSVVARTLRSILTLEYLASGGAGCTYPDARHSMARRWSHHLTFYGFLLCFASTTVAAFYHYALARLAPYPYRSFPVVLGTLGGACLLIGPASLYWLKRRRDPEIVDPAQDGLDVTFLALLFVSSVTGLLLLAFRQSHFMGALLVIHLAIVLALFATIPYGKFVHGIYRAAAVWRYAAEVTQRQPGQRG